MMIRSPSFLARYAIPLTGAIFVVALAGADAAAQSPPPAPPSSAAPAPVLAPPAASPPPTMVAPRPRALTQRVTPAPQLILPAKGSALSPDSVRPVPTPAPALLQANGVTRPASPPRTKPAPQLLRVPASAGIAAPAGVTMRCKDGTDLTGASSPARCDSHGGVAIIFPRVRLARP